MLAMIRLRLFEGWITLSLEQISIRCSSNSNSAVRLGNHFQAGSTEFAVRRRPILRVLVTYTSILKVLVTYTTIGDLSNHAAHSGALRYR